MAHRGTDKIVRWFIETRIVVVVPLGSSVHHSIQICSRGRVRVKVLRILIPVWMRLSVKAVGSAGTIHFEYGLANNVFLQRFPAVNERCAYWGDLTYAVDFVSSMSQRQ